MWVAIALVAGAPPLIWYDYSSAGGVLILPTLIGINMVLAAIRLLFMNLAVTESEQALRDRMRRYR